jgi:hypothetical protein
MRGDTIKSKKCATWLEVENVLTLMGFELVSKAC